MRSPASVLIDIKRTRVIPSHCATLTVSVQHNRQTDQTDTRRHSIQLVRRITRWTSTSKHIRRLIIYLQPPRNYSSCNPSHDYRSDSYINVSDARLKAHSIIANSTVTARLATPFGLLPPVEEDDEDEEEEEEEDEAATVLFGCRPAAVRYGTGSPSSKSIKYSPCTLPCTSTSNSAPPGCCVIMLAMAAGAMMRAL